MTANDKTTNMPFIVSGIAPACSVRAELGPPRTEYAVGALMQWLNKLYVVPYVSSGSKSGRGVGLY